MLSLKPKIRHFSLPVFIQLFTIWATGYESPSIGTLQVFPADNYWHWDISQYAVHPQSDVFVASVGVDKGLHPDFGTVWEGAPIGIPYTVVGAGETKVQVEYTAFGEESDSGPFPIPLDAPIEGGPQSEGDRHVISVDTASGRLYELYSAYPFNEKWQAQSGAEFDLTINDHHPDGWTSADAAGLPIFPGLVRYEEVERGEINHAIRITVQKTQRKYIYPASHFASTSTDSTRPPMGLRFRLKQEFDISGFPTEAQVILRALKKYGMIVADNGSDWFMSGAPDSRWDDDVLRTLKQVKGSDLEAVLTVDPNGDPIPPSSIRLPGVSGKGQGSVIGTRLQFWGFDLMGRSGTQSVVKTHP